MVTSKPLKRNAASNHHHLTVVVAHKTKEMPADDAKACWMPPHTPTKTATINVRCQGSNPLV